MINGRTYVLLGFSLLHAAGIPILALSVAGGVLFLGVKIRRYVRSVDS